MGLFSKIKNSFVKTQEATEKAPAAAAKKTTGKVAKSEPEKAAKPAKKVAAKTEKKSAHHWQNVHSDVLSVLMQPDVTEKSTNRIAENQYVFLVSRSASKPQIAHAVETLYKVEVTGVRVLNRRGKILPSGRTMGQRKAIKKAFVSVKKGQTISLFDNSEAA